jgi:glutamine amidotransferase
MVSAKVTVVDYGVGNILSIKRALEHCGADVELTDEHGRILEANRIILPGVGAFKSAMVALENLGLDEVIREIANRQIPLMGICLGMQLLLDQSSEFGIKKGLGIIPGDVIPLPKRSVNGEILRIPEIGWNALRRSGAASFQDTILQNYKLEETVYFVHSFMVKTKNVNHCIADYDFGGHPVTAVVQKDANLGCQFHPEKSGEVGLSMLRHFLSY